MLEQSVWYLSLSKSRYSGERDTCKAVGTKDMLQEAHLHSFLPGGTLSIPMPSLLFTETSPVWSSSFRSYQLRGSLASSSSPQVPRETTFPRCHALLSPVTGGRGCKQATLANCGKWVWAGKGARSGLVLKKHLIAATEEKKASRFLRLSKPKQKV